MFKSFAVLMAICVSGAIAFAGTISGKYTWLVGGTLTAAVTAKTTAQTVVVKVGATTYTLANTFVTGDPGTVYPIGTPFTVLETGSQPFAGTFSVLDVVVFNGYSDVLARRSVPMTAAGVLSANIGFPSAGAGSGQLTFFFPAFSVGTIEFKNGLVEQISVALPGFNLTIPTTTTPTFGVVNFPSSPALTIFRFLAIGNGEMSFEGSGTSDALTVCGTIPLGSPTIFTSAVLQIYANALQPVG